MSKESEIKQLDQRKIANEICLMLSGHSVGFSLSVLESIQSTIRSQSIFKPSKEILDENFESQIKWVEREYKFTYSLE